MSKASLRLKLAKLLLKFATMETDKGVLYSEGDFRIDAEVYIEDAEGNMNPAPDGEYVADGMSYFVEGGKIVNIKDSTSKEPIAEEEATSTEEKMEGEETPAEEIVEEIVETPNYEEAINTLVAAVEELTSRIEAIAADVEMLKEAQDKADDINEQFAKKKPKGNRPCWDKFSK